ncbi:MAG: TetR/AcrR family transcriptional regulator [Candidatus Izemoplasma sp.]|nr:TetR/AcrR family transcriptional regulator [Candidatus Izemoplasma sp.]
MPNQTFHNLPNDKQNRIIEAAINEFSQRDYESAMISKIIKDAHIPRGSFYQYFEGKKDLYKFLFTIIAKDKLSFMADEMMNKDNLPFIELVAILYKQGIAFATAHPKYLKITRFLFAKRDALFDEIMDLIYNLVFHIIKTI